MLAIAKVVLPIIVKMPCKVTKPYNSILLSYMCHVIAHIAPIKLGIIANPNQKYLLKFVYLLILLTINMVNTHSRTLDICITHVPIDNSLKI